jgi:hypothetical protein
MIRHEVQWLGQSSFLSKCEAIRLSAMAGWDVTLCPWADAAPLILRLSYSDD